MKTLRRFSIAPIFILFALLFPSCDWAPDFGDNFGDVGCLGCGEDWEINTIDEANRELTHHTWKISYSINPEFLNYKITFNTNKTLIATYGSTTYNGTWSITDENLNQKLISDLKLNLVFSTRTIFTQMSKKWTFNSYISDLLYDNQGDKINFIYISNGVTTDSFGLEEIK